jgi:hypothetical protein
MKWQIYRRIGHCFQEHFRVWISDLEAVVKCKNQSSKISWDCPIKTLTPLKNTVCFCISKAELSPCCFIAGGIFLLSIFLFQIWRILSFHFALKVGLSLKQYRNLPFLPRSEKYLISYCHLLLANLFRTGFPEDSYLSIYPPKIDSCTVKRPCRNTIWTKGCRTEHCGIWESSDPFGSAPRCPDRSPIWPFFTVNHRPHSGVQ